MTDKSRSSQIEALKATSIIGGSTAITILVRIIRTKFLAVLLGPTGIGLEAIYDSVVSLAKTVLDLGVSSAGVRQIAASMAKGDQRQVAATTITLRRVCLILGLAGATALYVLREPVSRMAFDNVDYSDDIGLLSVILLLGSVVGGQGALLQGARRIGDLAKMRIFGAIGGAAVSIPLVYVWGSDGIVPYMVAAAAIGAVVSWFYARRVAIASIRISLSEIGKETTQLLKLGVVFVTTGLMSTSALFLIRTFVTRQEGLIGTGQFQAASALATIYVGFVLQAMATDFYPRLTALAEDNRRCNQLVNEQTEISVLLALPGVLATLAIAPWVIRFFYTGKFDQAVEILYWQLPGVFLQVNSWPMGFILLAKGRAGAFFWTDLAAYSLYVALAWVGLRWVGLPGTGMAFLGLYLFHWVVIFAVSRKISGFSLSTDNIRLSLFGVVALALTFWARVKMPEPWSSITGGLVALFASLYCFRLIIRLIGMPKIEPYLRKFRMSFLMR